MVNRENGVSVKQRLQKFVRIVLASVASVVLLASVQPLVASAANDTANTLKVTPVRSDITVNPGENKTVHITVANLTAAPITVRPIENDFIAGDERGTPALILDADKYAPTHSLKRYMLPMNDVTIPANDAKVIDVTIAVPADAQAGGYFGAVRFAPTDPDGGGQVNLSASVASLILMSVPGPVTEKLNLTKFDIEQNGQANAYFRTPDNLQVAFRFENQGSIQEGPTGKISVQKGKELVYEADFNNKDPKDMILPDSARRWEIPLKKIDTFGHYTVTGTFTYGQKNQTIQVSKSFWVIPLYMIIAAIAILVILIALIAFIVSRILRRKRRNDFRSGKGGNFRL